MTSLPYTAFAASLLGITFCGSVFLSHRIYLKNNTLSSGDTLLTTSAPVLLWIALSLIASFLLWLPFNPWSGVNLFTTFAILEGIDVFSGQEGGLLVTVLYPPMAYLSYILAYPAHNPIMAIYSAGAINFLFLVAPMAALIRAHSRWAEITPGAPFLALAFFCALIIPSDALTSMTLTIHADAPALAFAVLACVPIYGQGRQIHWTRLALSAVLASLSVYSKQPLVVIYAALITYIWLIAGVRTLWRFIGFCALAGFALSAIMLMLFGFDALLFSIWTFPKSHHWRTSLLPPLINVAQASWPYLIILAAFLVAGYKHFKTSKHLAVFSRDKPWMLFSFLIIFSLPLSIAAQYRVGGSLNSFHALYFLLITTTILFLETFRVKDGAPLHARRWGRAIGIIALFIGLVLSTSYIRPLPDFTKNPEEIVFRYTKAHPGRAYFPWNPLSSLMSEHRAYHVDDGVYVYVTGGFQITKEQIERHVPKDMQYIIIDPKDVYFSFPATQESLALQGPRIPKYHRTLNFFKEYKRMSEEQIQEDPDLKGIPESWIVYRKPDRT